MKTNNRFKFLMTTALLIASAHTSYAQDGHQGGGFADYKPSTWVAEQAADLVSNLSTLEPGTSAYLPTQSSLDALTDALKNIEILSTTSRSRGGRELILDFDLARNRIQVLKGFFDRITITSKKEDAAPIIRNLLLHEVGHLVGYLDDDSAEKFANEMQYRLTGRRINIQIPDKAYKIDGPSFVNRKFITISCEDIPTLRDRSNGRPVSYWIAGGDCKKWMEKMRHFGTNAFAVEARVVVSMPNREIVIINSVRPE